MELIDLEPGCDSNNGPDVPVNTAENVLPGVESLLFDHLAECLEWLFNSDYSLRLFRPEEIDLFQHTIESPIEDTTDSTTTAADYCQDCDEEHWLSSLENNSELNHQVAIDEVSTQKTVAASEGEAFITFPFPPTSLTAYCGGGSGGGSGSSSSTDFDSRDDSSPPSSSSLQGNGTNSKNNTLGFISDILDGVVFTPLHGSDSSSEAIPRPSPGTARCRSNLSSFRPPPSTSSSSSFDSQFGDEQNNTTTTTTTNPLAASPFNNTNNNKKKEGSSASSLVVKSPSSPSAATNNVDLESLFQQELAAKIKKRSQGHHHNNKTSNKRLVAAGAAISIRSHQQSALPPIPQETSLEEAAAHDSSSSSPSSPSSSEIEAEYDNPLYQTLEDCLSGGGSLEAVVEQQQIQEEATYADIADVGVHQDLHYQTVPVSPLRSSSSTSSDGVDSVAQKQQQPQIKSQVRVYAQVDTIQDETLYANAFHAHQSPSLSSSGGGESLIVCKVQVHHNSPDSDESIYENVEELLQDQQEQLEEDDDDQQTYANVVLPSATDSKSNSSSSSSSSGVLTALILDVDSAANASSASSNRCSNSSSSGNSSTSPPLTSSPEQLSPVSSDGSVHSAQSNDSGVFGLLLKPAASATAEPSAPPKRRNLRSLVIEIKSESTDQLKIEEKEEKEEEDEETLMMDETLRQFEQLEEELKAGGSPGVLTMGEMIPIETLLDLAGPIEPSQVVLNDGDDEEEDSNPPPQMPMSPPPQFVQPKAAPRSSFISYNNDHDGDDDEDDQDLFQASFVSVDSQASNASTTIEMNNNNSNNDEHDSSLSERVMSPSDRGRQSSNLGAKIVEDEVKKQKEMDRVRIEKLGLEDVGESFEKLNMKRYDIINEMTPKKRNLILNSSGAFSPPPVDESPFSPLDGSTKKPGGVNSESILVKKEETKAFWEGKMQPLDDSYPIASNSTKNNVNINNNRFVQKQQQPVALSPPPGFDNDFDGVSSSRYSGLDETDRQQQQSSLSNDDFTEVASITVVSGSATPEPDGIDFDRRKQMVQQEQYVFGDEDDEEEEEEAEVEDYATTRNGGGKSTAPREKLIVKQMRPKPEYFERPPSSIDDDLDDLDEEDDLPVSVTSRSSGGTNPTETLIEREIRLQREREEAVLRERQMALEMLQANRKNSSKNKVMAEQEMNNKKEAPMCFKPAQPPTVVAAAAAAPEVMVLATSNKTRPEPKKQQQTETISSAEIRIAEEIRELKRREEELRKLRDIRGQQNGGVGEDLPSFTPSGATDDEGLYSDAERDASNSSDANSSRVESPEAGIVPSEYSKFAHQRTHSMDSMSSGHSSGDHGSANSNNKTNNKKKTEQTLNKQQQQQAAMRPTTVSSKSVVMPLEDEAEDEEDTPAYRRVSKETPIEREIRLGREREEALRKEKGLQPAWTSTATKQNEKENRKSQRVGGGGEDKRDVQHRLATSIIQKEIDETSEREIELVKHGKIQTTSIQRVDSKVARLGDYTSKRMKPNKEHIPSSVKSAPVTKAVNGDSVQRPEQPKQKKTKGDSPQVKGSSSTSSTSTSNRGFGSNNPSAPPNAANAVSATSSATWRTFSNPQGGQRGLMEKFILSRGRISSPTAFTGPAAPYVTPGSPAGDLVGVSNHSKVNYNKPARFAQSTAAANKTNAAPVMQPIVSSLTLKDVATKAEIDESSSADKSTPPRRHYATTEEKIQQEFREMQKREEELRLNRSKMFAKSQPNLLTCLDAEDAEVGINSNGEYDQSRTNGQIRAAHSISDLLAEEPQSLERDGGYQNSSSASVKGARRKSALIAQWESRIQQDF